MSPSTERFSFSSSNHSPGHSPGRAARRSHSARLDPPVNPTGGRVDARTGKQSAHYNGFAKLLKPEFQRIPTRSGAPTVLPTAASWTACDGRRVDARAGFIDDNGQPAPRRSASGKIFSGRTPRMHFFLDIHSSYDIFTTTL
jgi:hypothetical protein